MSDVCFGIKAIFAMSRHTPECRMAIKLVLYEPHFRNEQKNHKGNPYKMTDIKFVRG